MSNVIATFWNQTLPCRVMSEHPLLCDFDECSAKFFHAHRTQCDTLLGTVTLAAKGALSKQLSLPAVKRLFSLNVEMSLSFTVEGFISDCLFWADLVLAGFVGWKANGVLNDWMIQSSKNNGQKCNYQSSWQLLKIAKLTMWQHHTLNMPYLIR